MFVWPVPFGFIVQMSPARAKAMRVPSGDHVGLAQVSGGKEQGACPATPVPAAPEPSRFISQSSPVQSDWKTILVPSGEKSGWPNGAFATLAVYGNVFVTPDPFGWTLQMLHSCSGPTGASKAIWLPSEAQVIPPE